jgi:hypothetical protein
MHTAMHSLFNIIAIEHYNKYKHSLQQYNELTNNNEQWDFDKHSNEETVKYISLFREKEKNAIISVVFIVMSIEGLINEYGFYHLGENQFNEQDSKRILEKIADFYIEVTKIKFPKDKLLYQKIQDVVALRNTLVHSKPIGIDWKILMRNDEEAEKQYYSYINSMIGNKKSKAAKQKFLFEILDKSYNVYSELKTFLQQDSNVN